MPVPNTKGNPAAHRDPVPGADGRRRALSRQARRGRHRARDRRRLPRRPRDPARGRALPRPGQPPLGRVADAAGRRAHQRRPLGGRVPRRHDGPLAVDDRGVERRLRHLARRAAAQDRRRRRRTSPASCPRASCCSRRPRAAPRAPTARRSRHALETMRGPGAPPDAALAPDLFAAMERASQRTGASPARHARWRSRSTASPPPSPPGTSCSRARGAASRRSRSRSPRSPSSASTSSTSRPSTRSASRRARAATTR